MVEHVLAKDETGVRFSLAAHYISVLYAQQPKLIIKGFLSKSVDNHVYNVYKGHNIRLSFNHHLVKNRPKNKDILVKDTKI